MKKINLLLFALFLFVGAFAQKGNLVMPTPELGVQYSVSAMSPNGKWACGNIFDGMERGFVWNLNTGEITELSLPGSSSAARSISDNGVVSGSFETTVGTPNNRPITVYGRWEKGVWTELEIENDQNGAMIDLEGLASTISRNGEYIAGIAHSGKAYLPIVWENGSLNIVDNIEGAVYDISDDGNMLCGWTTHPVKKNRTSALWKKQADGKYSKTCIDLDSPYAAGPFSVATGMSPNMKYVIACNTVLNVETGDTVRHDLDYFRSGFELFGVTNDGSAYGFIDDGDMPGGDAKRAVLVSLDHKITYLRDYFIECGINLDQYPYVQSVIAISEDEKTYALNVYDVNFQPASLIIKMDAEKRMAPVGLSVRNLEGINGNFIAWKAPLFTDKVPVGYNLYRNDVKLNSEVLTSMSYVDSNLETGEYTYTVTAVYERKIESEKSENVTINIQSASSNAPTMLHAYRSGLNDVRLLWEKPLSNLPALRYFNDDDVIAGLGGGYIGFECGIAARAEELKLYKDAGYKITEISFVPKSRQNKWTVNFYVKDSYETPLYSEEIASENLKYGMINYYTLQKPFEIPEGKDIVMSINIDVTNYGGYNVIGMCPKKADAGYSDLIRQEGEENFYSLYDASMNSEYGAMEYNVCWAIGMHFAKGDEANTVKQYLVSADGEQMGTATENMFRVNNMTNGNHKFDVVAEYEGGVKSAPASVDLNVYADKNLCTTVTPVVTPGEGKATLTWEAPAAVDNDIITFSNNETSGGVLPRKSDDYSYTIASIYKGNELLPFENFEITGCRFYPLGDANFTFHLLKDNEEVALQSMNKGEGYQLEEWNLIKFDEPVMIDRNSVYTLVIDCFECTPEETPVGMDSQSGCPNISDLYSTDGGYSYSSIILDGGKDASWMIGLDVASVEKNVLPVEGYNVYLDNEKKNNDVVTENTYVLDNLEPATYSVRVNPVYPEGIGEKESNDVTFVIEVSGIDEISGNTYEIVRDAEQIMINGADVDAIELYDMSGAMAAQSNCNVINIASLNNGVYVMKVKMNGKCVSSKIAVRR